jgi:hypothetical protein
MDSGIADPLFKLLFDLDLQVKIEATATLCNIVLDFSPMKNIVVEKGGVQQLVQLIKSDCDELTLNAAWALKNMLFQANFSTKKKVMENLGFDTLISIIKNGNTDLQVQGLTILRNLACSKTEVFIINLGY